MTGTIGVAISTTGDEHRMGFLETCVRHWKQALGLGGVLAVTVDGDRQAAARVVDRIYPLLSTGPMPGGVIYRVGQPNHRGGRAPIQDGRMGVAANKNSGLEFLMSSGVEHLFLCDDDTWPLSSGALGKHLRMASPHSMVCWGKSRLDYTQNGYAAWNWPRGVVLYTRRHVVEQVGGMDEMFGPGGHEHAEWSRRIHQAGLTPAPFISPLVYSLRGVSGNACRADQFWHAEDMRRPGEMPHEWDARKRANTTIQTKGRDWDRIEKVMQERDGDTSFVPYKAHENGRSSATLCSSSSCAVEPETPRSGL